MGADAPPPLAGVTHRFVDAGGLRVHVAEAGDGPPLVLLHGFPQHWWCWREVLALLGDRFRLVVPDLRGAGWTAAPAEGYGKAQLAADLLALLDALGLRRVRLAGHDWGGWIALAAALRAPERVEHVTALCVPHPFARPRPALLGAAAAFWYQPVLASPLGPALLRRPALVRRILRRSLRRPEAMDERTLALYAERLRDPARARAGSALYRTALLELPAAARGPRPRLAVPSRLVLAGEDPWVRPAWLDGLPGEVVPGAGHFLPEERPGLVAERLAAGR